MAFTTAGGVPALRVARWNGSAWSAFGAGFSSAAYDLLPLANGELLAVSSGSATGFAASGIARWDGSAWQGLGVGFNLPINALAAMPNGDVIAGGLFSTAGAFAAAPVARWNGAAWTPMPPFSQSSNCAALVAMPDGSVVAGGGASQFAGPLSTGIGRWDGAGWSTLGSGFAGGSVLSLAVLPNGDLVAAGRFTSAGGVPANNVARWNGAAWSPLGSGLVGTTGFETVDALLALPNGDLIAGGSFTTAGGVAANRVARWNGVAWSALGGGITGASAVVRSLAVLPDGAIVAGGLFEFAGGLPIGNIARWNGTAWSALGSGANDVVRALAVLPDGDVVAGGAFTAIGGVAASRIARWTGAAWSAMSSGVSNSWFSATAVHALAVRANGELAVGGSFVVAGGQPSAYFARYASPCPASATPIGVGCAGTGGVNVLTARSLPWTGSIFRTRATGLASFGFCVTVNGFSGVSLPLAAVMPTFAANCTLLASPDVLDVTVIFNGTFDAQVPLPNTPSLAGIVLRQQIAMHELDAGGAIVRSTVSNALAATIGTF